MFCGFLHHCSCSTVLCFAMGHEIFTILKKIILFSVHGSYSNGHPQVYLIGICYLLIFKGSEDLECENKALPLHILLA